MNNQKVNFIPTVNGVPISDYAPINEFTSLDIIDMPEADKAWSMYILAKNDGGMIMGGRIKIYASNSLDFDFVQYDIEAVSFEFGTPVIISESRFNYRYMLLDLELSEGSVSISMVK